MGSPMGHTLKKKNYIKYYTTVFTFNEFSELLASLGSLKVNFKKNIEANPQEDNTLIMNMSMQCLYVFQITYLKPKIDFNKRD